jgi:signal transduction histidine kinase
VSAELGGGELLLAVIDDGAGVPEAVLPRVFEPLFTTKLKGTGLGLAVSANIVRQHEGTVWVESVIGGGARFMVRLPCRAAA